MRRGFACPQITCFETREHAPYSGACVGRSTRMPLASLCAAGRTVRDYLACTGSCWRVSQFPAGWLSKRQLQIQFGCADGIVTVVRDAAPAEDVLAAPLADARSVVASVMIIARVRTDARSSMAISCRIELIDTSSGRSAHVRRSAIDPAFELCVTTITGLAAWSQPRAPSCGSAVIAGNHRPQNDAGISLARYLLKA